MYTLRITQRLKRGRAHMVSAGDSFINNYPGAKYKKIPAVHSHIVLRGLNTHKRTVERVTRLLCCLCVFFRIKCRLLLYTRPNMHLLPSQPRCRAVVGGNIIINGTLIPSVFRWYIYERVSHITYIHKLTTAHRKVNGRRDVYGRCGAERASQYY